MNQIYREQLIDHYRNPRNSGEIKNTKYVAELKNLSCGDEISMYVEVIDNKIIDVKFQGSGCAICIASASMLTEMVKESTIEEMLEMEYKDIEETIGIPLSPSRIKCAHLGLLTLQKALRRES